MTVATIADLKAATPSTTDHFVVKGYASPGDGGGGLFFWDDSVPIPSLSDEDGGTIFKSDVPGVTGRWKRIYEKGFINVLWFGVQRDTSTDQAVAINKAIDALTKDGKGGDIFIPPGTYLISSGILLKSNIRVQGSGALLNGTGEPTLAGYQIENVTILPGLKVRNSGSHMVAFKHSTNIRIQGISCAHDPTNTSEGDAIWFFECGRELRDKLGNIIVPESDANIWVEDCYVENAGRVGITIEACNSRVSIHNNYLKNCREGIHFEDARDIICSNNILDHCGNAAIGDPSGYVNPITIGLTNNLQLTGNIFKNNTEYIEVLGCPCDQVVFSENTGLPSIWVSESSPIGQVYISNFSLLNNQGGSLNRNGPLVTTRGRFDICNNRDFKGTDLGGFTYALIKNNTATPEDIFDIRADSTVNGSYLEMSGNVHKCNYYGLLQADFILFENNTFTPTKTVDPAVSGYAFFGNGKVIARNNKSYELPTKPHFYFANPNAVIELHGNQLAGIITAAGTTPGTTITADFHILQQPGMYRMSAMPTSGLFKQGDLVFNTNPAASSPLGWVCQAGGSPGTWAPFSII